MKSLKSLLAASSVEEWNVQELRASCIPFGDAGADPGFLLRGGAPLRNDVTIQDFS